MRGHSALGLLKLRQIWRSAFVLIGIAALMTISAVQLFGVSSRHPSNPVAAPLHFKGGIIVQFRPGVPDAVMMKTATAVNAIIHSRESRENTLILRFDPPIPLVEAELIAKQLTLRPEVKFAIPEYG